MVRLGWVNATIVASMLGALIALGGCGQFTPKYMKPLSAHTRALLAEKGMTEDSPILIRIFKAESELEVWKAKDDGRFYHFKTYPICSYSGGLGPKLKQGDRQAPEGFYYVNQSQMNPRSKYHLAFNMGYPNAYDRANGRTGAHLMVHGDCSSSGCYAMTDAVMEEIYILAREALAGDQNRAVGSCNLADEPKSLLHRRAAAYDALEAATLVRIQLQRDIVDSVGFQCAPRIPAVSNAGHISA